MQTRNLEIPFEVKALSEDGVFSGYGSVFGVIDSYDDVVAKGAFNDSLAAHRAKGRMPALLWQHRSGEPIGVYTDMAEDAVGLKLTGKLALKTTRGAEAYELLKMGAISGLSIGYVEREGSLDKVTGIRTITKLDLWETSLVTFPANDAARVQQVRGIETIESLKDAERCLRDAGMSRTEAVAFIARVKSLGQRDADDGVIEALKQCTTILTT